RAIGNQVPLLVSTKVVGELNDLCCIGCTTTEDIRYQATIPVGNLIVTGRSIAGQNTAGNRVAPFLLDDVVIVIPGHICSMRVRRSKGPGAEVGDLKAKDWRTGVVVIPGIEQWVGCSLYLLVGR